MSIEGSHDPRDRLVREKYFSLRPKPLEQWLWQQGLPGSAERVFWLHWEQGMRNRDWCSEIPVRQVARECLIDVSSVTRAYQLLRSLGLIRREDPGRDPTNPFRQSTPVTEVRIPRILLVELERYPSRRTPPAAAAPAQRAEESRATTQEKLPASPEPAPIARRWTRPEIGALWARVSAAEAARYHQADHQHLGSMSFDPETKLSAEERGLLLQLLAQGAAARSRVPVRATCAQEGSFASVNSPRRRLTAFELARARRAIMAVTPTAQQAAELLRQVAWAVEEGALRRFDMLKALNIALKKIRAGEWTRPNRMPPNWRRLNAEPEVCSAA
jgi:hypothetical protein